MSRAEFAACLEDLRRACDARRAVHDKTHPIQLKHRNAAAEAWKAHVRTASGKPWKVPLAEDGHPDIYVICARVGDAHVKPYLDPIVVEAEALYAQLDAEVKRLERRADELSQKCAIEKGGAWRGLSTHDEWTYSTQGLGAASYARGAAESALDPARNAGVECRVAAKDKLYVAEVHVQTELDVEIVRRLPTLPLREWVRLCWKRGVNPRVRNPYLPHGYEEREGLDFFGNDLRALKS